MTISTRLTKVSAAALAALLLGAGSAMADDWSPLWSTTTLSHGRYSMGAASAGGKVFFGGGYAGNNYYSDVDIFDATTLAHSTASLSKARGGLAATSSDGEVFFGGGWGGSDSSVVDVFDAATLTRSTKYLSQARSNLAATSAGGKVFFGGGVTTISPKPSKVVDVFDADTLTRATTSLMQARQFPAATSAGGKAFFAGGEGSSGWSSEVDVFDAATLVRTTTSLSQAREDAAATSAGGKVFFAGGSTPDAKYSVVDIFDADTLTHTTSSLSLARTAMAAASVGGKAFFAGGYTGTVDTDVVDIYDTAGGTWSIAHLSQARDGLSAAATGNRIFFAGGYDYAGNTISNVVDIYTLQSYGAITSTQAFALADQTTVAGRMQLDGGSLNLGTYGLTVGSMSGTAPINLSGQTLTAGGDGTSSTYSGALSGHGNLAKIGGGTLTLSGTNSYDGTTYVSGGALNATGSIASGVVVAGGTLQGTGHVGAITGTSGHLHPGGSPGILQSGSLTMVPGFDFDVSLDGPTVGTGYSQLAVTGTVDLGGATLAATLGYVPAFCSGGLPDVLCVLRNDGADPVVGQFNDLPQMSHFGLVYNGTTYEATISYRGDYDTGSLVGGNDVVIALPEPATLSLLGLGALAALQRRRGHRGA